MRRTLFQLENTHPIPPMPRIPEKNRRFRTKDEICRDVAFILLAPLAYGTKFAVLADVVWAWSEFHGKIDGCPYWSEAAWLAKSKPRGLMHEHVVPKKVVIDKLLSLEAPSTEEVRDVLDRFCIGVVVTREEDARMTRLGLRSEMPENWDGVDPWARYAKAGIALRNPT